MSSLHQTGLCCAVMTALMRCFLDSCLTVLTDVIIIVLKADAIKDEILDELGLFLVNVLCKMKDVSLDCDVNKVGEAYC